MFQYIWIRGKRANVTLKQNHHQNILHMFYLKGMIQIVDIRVSNSPLFIPSEAAERWSLSFCFGSNSFFSRIVIKNCINATNYGLQGTRNPMLLCDGTQLSCKHPFTIIILINPAKNNSLWDGKEIISYANSTDTVSAFVTAKLQRYR